MTDSLRERLMSVLTPLCDAHLSEAEVDGYPFAVVDLTTAPRRSKDGIYAYTGDARIRIVGDDFDIIDQIRSEVEGDIAMQMHDGTFHSSLTDVDKECVDGIWTIELNYTLKQYADWDPENNDNVNDNVNVNVNDNDNDNDNE